MLASNIPAKITTPFASSAGASFIRTVPVPSQIGTTAGAASFTDGFPPLCFSPVAAGGFPPDGRDVNYILQNLSAWARWISAAGLCGYDASFQTAIGGYPAGAALIDATNSFIWLSQVDNNATDPDTGGAGWGIAGPFASGTRLTFQQSTAPTGWTKDTTLANDAIMRIVTGTVSTGGSQGFTTWNGLTATGGHSLTTGELAAHSHTITDPGHFHANGVTVSGTFGASAGGANIYVTANTTTKTTGISINNNGSGTAHTHPLSNGVKYCDFVICQKN